MTADPTTDVDALDELVAAEAAVAAARRQLQRVQRAYCRHEAGYVDVLRAHHALGEALDTLASTRAVAP